MESQQIKLFTHEQFGKVRVVTIDDDPWFVGKDVATALGYTNTRDALAKHVPDKFKRVINAKDFQQMASQSKSREMLPLEFDSPRGFTFVNEPGIYRLILRSNMPKAEEFTDWVCGEVLPSIRKTGSYSLAPAPVAKPAPNPNRRAGQLSDACVYVFDLGNGTVKIGQSHDVNRRATDIKRETGLAVIKKYHTPFMSREVARLIEQACKKNFSSRHVKGEIFSVKFNEACAVIDSFVEFAAALTTSKVAVISTKLIAGRKTQ